MKSDFAKIFPYMTRKERDHHVMLSMCGMPQFNNGKLTVLMGKESIERVEAHKAEMVEKYRVYLDLDKQQAKARFPKPKSKYHN